MITKRSHILKQTCSWYLQVCLSMCDLSVTTRYLRVKPRLPKQDVEKRTPYSNELRWYMDCGDPNGDFYVSIYKYQTKNGWRFEYVISRKCYILTAIILHIDFELLFLCLTLSSWDFNTTSRRGPNFSSRHLSMLQFLMKTSPRSNVRTELHVEIRRSKSGCVFTRALVKL